MGKSIFFLALLFTALLWSCIGYLFGKDAGAHVIKREIRDTCISEKHGGTDYQIEVYNDTVWVYDGDRLISAYITNWKNQLDSVLIKDNQ